MNNVPVLEIAPVPQIVISDQKNTSRGCFFCGRITNWDCVKPVCVATVDGVTYAGPKACKALKNGTGVTLE